MSEIKKFKERIRMIFGQFVVNILVKNRCILLSYAYPKSRDLRNGVILYYNEPKRAKAFDRIRSIKNKIETVLSYSEAYQLSTLVQAVSKIPGNMAEVGTFMGGSAKIILEVEREKTLHIFDTFEGLPERSDVDNKHFTLGEYKGTLNTVKTNLRKYTNVRFHRGIFPSTAKGVQNIKFSFVHLDVDLFEGTINSLEFFYPRMNKGGIILSHDYISAKGVQKAFDKFFNSKPEVVVEMSGSGSQCMIVKM